jgi:hypothetical protein
MQIFMLNMYNLLRFIQNPIGSVVSNTLGTGDDVSVLGGGASDAKSPNDTKVETAMKNGTISNFMDVANVLNFIVRKVLGPVFSVMGIAFVIMAVKIGFEYAKAQDASEREKCKGKLIGMIVGGLIMIAGAVLAFSVDWSAMYYNMNGMSHKFADSSLDSDDLCDLCSQSVDHSMHK